MSEKNQAAYWASIKRGDQLALQDEKTLIEQMKAKKGLSPIQMSVSRVMNIRITTPKKQIIGEYVVIGLGDQKPWLVAKVVGDEFSLTVYKAAEDWQPATRKELMAQDCTFLFEPPDDNRDPGWEQRLHYIDELKHGDVDYRVKAQGELTGEVQGVRGQFATVVEYVSGKEGEPELAVFEIGEGENGLISIMLGRQVTSSDVDVVKR